LFQVKELLFQEFVDFYLPSLSFKGILVSALHMRGLRRAPI
jgi:hypothetical protein